ncbi:MAG: preprotein translocase subunit SecE [Acidaminococcaceae bacterium]|nr:preprotein translocase subunit SecE [Acidaminococcaceae bacterium]
MGGNNPFGFVRGTIEELKKVSWPTRQEIINNTAVVLVAVAFCAALIWVIDTFFSVVFRWILQ